tara:strand:- start:51024 stop:52973 length:1950 start_codon:yes stop_codon:yes gene_type:complete
LKILLKAFSFVVLVILLFAGVLFFRPDIVINEKLAGLALDKAPMIEDYSWSEFEFNQEYLSWNKRRFKGHIDNFCVDATTDMAIVDTCFESIRYDLVISYGLGEGVQVSKKSFFSATSDESNVRLLESKESPKEDPEEKIDLYELYQLGWSPFIPKIFIELNSINLSMNQSDHILDFKFKRTNENATVSLNELKLSADRKGLEISLEPNFSISKVLPEFLRNIRVGNAKVLADIKEEEVSVYMDADSSGININAQSSFESEVYPSKIPEQALVNLHGKIQVSDVESTLKALLKAPYNKLPAPINEMQGRLTLKLDGKDLASKSAGINTELIVDFSSEQQKLDFKLDSFVKINLGANEVELVDAFLNVKQVALYLPRLPKKSLPPQMRPDSRIFYEEIKFENTLAQRQEEDEEAAIPLNLNIVAEGENALNIRTNLLDSPIRINMNIKVENSELQNAFVKVLPLETEIFKREIRLNKLEIYQEGETALLDAVVEFILPEYNVFLKLEGPMSEPRYAFSSTPALAQGDIISVLLFGRPLEGVGTGDQEAVARTNELISQGILSLSVLYFFAGSPIEAVVYDPDSNEVGAQIGLTRKSSLNVGGGAGGVSSVGVRYSLGGGWYIDTSAREKDEIESDLSTDYGVMLERILAY